PAAREITYTVCTFAPTKPNKKPDAKPMKSDIIKLNSDEPFDTLKAQLLVKIDKVLHPDTLHYDQFEITYTVPRQVSNAIELDSNQQYEHLVDNALKIKASANAKICVRPKPVSRFGLWPTPWLQYYGRNEAINVDDDDGERKKKKKTKEDGILPGNVAVNEKIGILRAKWVCPTLGGACASTHCYVKPDSPGHFPLGNEHFRVWAAAWVKGTEYADDITPPNAKCFDGVNDDALGARSPLLQRRLEAQNQKKAGALAPIVPQVNINFPAEFLQVLRPPVPPPALDPAPAPGHVRAPALAASSLTPMLIPAGRMPGPKLTVEEFCQQHELGDDIHSCFKAHRFKSTDSFRFIELAQLDTMGFLAGEIAELKVAIEAWAGHSEG
ncbi:hypothetical protein DFH06DRAFT_1017460, partial [Mycena polygramma]